MKKITLILLALFVLPIQAQKNNEINHFSMDTLRWEKMTDKVYRKFAYGSNSMIAYLKLEKGAFIPKHNHPNEQITHILEGKVEITMEGRKFIVGKGEVIIIPPNVPHSFIALETTLDMDIFGPVRMDWINKSANYFPPSKPKELVTVAKWTERPGNVTVTSKGGVFATVHPLGNPSTQLMKVVNANHSIPFPSKEWQKSPGQKATAKTFDTPLGITSDSKNNIWLIDMGLDYGKTRLFAFNAESGKKIFEFTFPESLAPKGSFIQDLAIDEVNGFVYLADINNPRILVVDVKKKVARAITSDASFKSENIDMKIDGKVIQFGGAPARVAINPITISANKDTLYYGAMNGRKWFQISAKAIRSNFSNEAILKTIQKVGEKPISDGAASDGNGNHYFTNLNEKGIDFWKSSTKTLEPFVRDERLDWADNVAIGKDGYLYIAVNQLYKTPAFSGAADTGNAPYYIYKVKIID